MIHAIIIPTPLLEAGNARAIGLGVTNDGHSTFVVALVPAAGPDDAEATHHACHGQISPVAYDAVMAEIPSWPGALWWSYDVLTHALLVSHDGQHLGEPWSWAASLAAAGLKAGSTPSPIS